MGKPAGASRHFEVQTFRLLLVPLVRYRVIDNIFAFKKRHALHAKFFHATSLPLAPPFMQQSLVPLYSYAGCMTYRFFPNIHMFFHIACTIVMDNTGVPGDCYALFNCGVFSLPQLNQWARAWGLALAAGRAFWRRKLSSVSSSSTSRPSQGAVLNDSGTVGSKKSLADGVA